MSVTPTAYQLIVKQAQVELLIHLTIRLKSVWNVHAGADDSAVLHKALC